MSNRLSIKTKEYNDMIALKTKEYNDMVALKTKEYNELKEIHTSVKLEHDKLKNKFEGLKNFFT